MKTIVQCGMVALAVVLLTVGDVSARGGGVVEAAEARVVEAVVECRGVVA